MNTDSSHAPLSAAHSRLERALRRCPGTTSSLRASLVGTLDADTADALARLLEVMAAEPSRSLHSGFVRGFLAGQ